MKPPAHLRSNPTRLQLLRRWANQVATRYGEPVYLCGSALLDGNSDPRDWDVRIELPPATFKRFYGDPKQWEDQGASGDWTRVRFRWSDDCVKGSKHGYSHTGLNIDFQVYPAEYAKRLYGRMPKLRLNSRRAA